MYYFAGIGCILHGCVARRPVLKKPIYPFGLMRMAVSKFGTEHKIVICTYSHPADGQSIEQVVDLLLRVVPQWEERVRIGLRGSKTSRLSSGTKTVTPRTLPPGEAMSSDSLATMPAPSWPDQKSMPTGARRRRRGPAGRGSRQHPARSCRWRQSIGGGLRFTLVFGVLDWICRGLPECNVQTKSTSPLTCKTSTGYA